VRDLGLLRFAEAGPALRGSAENLTDCPWRLARVDRGCADLVMPNLSMSWHSSNERRNLRRLLRLLRIMALGLDREQQLTLTRSRINARGRYDVELGTL
jgi:hypothetical protein